MLKVEAIVLDAVRGELKNIIINDDVYETRFIGHYSDVAYETDVEADVQEEIPVTEQTPEFVSGKMLGEFIKTVNDVPIFEFPLFELKNLKNKNDSNRIIQDFFPYLTNSKQVQEYVNTYFSLISGNRKRKDLGIALYKTKNYTIYSVPVKRMEEGETPEIVLRDCYPAVQTKTIMAYARKYKDYLAGNLDKEKTPKTNGPKKSKKYNMFVLNSEIKRVEQSLRKFNFITTTKNISKETGFTIQKVRAVLDVLITDGVVKRSNDKEGRVVYSLV